MEFKFPKKLEVADTIFEIKYDKTQPVGSGSFGYGMDGNPAYLKFTIKYIDKYPLRFLTILMHELMEILHVEDNTRLYRSDAKNDIASYIFVSDHDQFSDRCCRLSGLLSKFIK